MYTIAAKLNHIGQKLSATSNIAPIMAITAIKKPIKSINLSII